MKAPSSIIFFILYFAVSSSASADIRIKQYLAIDCRPGGNDPFNVIHDFALPPLVAFSIGHRWTAGLPLTGKVGNEEKGASDPTHLTIQISETLLVVSVGRAIVIRLVTPRLRFCQQAEAIEASMTVSDRRSERITIQLLPATSNFTEFDTTAVTSKIFDLYRDSFAYFLSHSQPWIKDFLQSVEDDGARPASATKFCNGCSWIAHQRLAYGLGRFLETYPSVLNFPALNDLGGVFHAPLPEDFQCTYGEVKKGELNYSTPFDSVLRFVPENDKNSYLEFRARRTSSRDLVGLEKVVIRGELLGERCE